jgi:hypothetical protein
LIGGRLNDEVFQRNQRLNTAPANGWFYHVSGGGHEFANLTGGYSWSGAVTDIGGAKMLFPVNKGDQIAIYYTKTSYLIFRFIYADGSEND